MVKTEAEKAAAKAAKEAEKAAAKAAKDSASGFVVLDSNGKEVRVVDSEEEATSLAAVYGGRVKPS